MPNSEIIIQIFYLYIPQFLDNKAFKKLCVYVNDIFGDQSTQLTSRYRSCVTASLLGPKMIQVIM